MLFKLLSVCTELLRLKKDFRKLRFLVNISAKYRDKNNLLQMFSDAIRPSTFRVKYAKLLRIKCFAEHPW